MSEDQAIRKTGVKADPIAEMLKRTPEIFEAGSGSKRSLRMKIDSDQEVVIPRPTPMLKKWLSGRSKDYSDKAIAERIGVAEYRVASFRSGTFPMSFEVERLAKVFAYPADCFVQLIFMYARKRYKRLLEDAVFGRHTGHKIGRGYVLAIVPQRVAYERGYPTFAIQNFGEPMVGITGDDETIVARELRVLHAGVKP